MKYCLTFTLFIANLVIYAQKIEVVLFFDTECPICQAYTGRLQRLYEQHKHNVVFNVYYPTEHVSRKSIRRFSKDYKFHLPAKLDTEHRSVNQYKARITPEVFVINKVGEVVYSGAIDNQFVELGKARPKASEFYLAQVLDSLRLNSYLTVSRQEPVGCLINLSKKSPK